MTRLQNPFASPQLSLSLPQSYKKDSKRDDHGKGDMTFLDTSFEFLDFVTVSGAKIQLDGNNATTFSDKLKKHLVASIAINEYFEDVFQNEGKDLVDLFNQDKISLSNLGVDPIERLTLCQGDCDAGSCADGLECFQRDEGGDGPPECKGAPKDDWDYCIETEKGSIVHVTKHFSDITQIKEVLDNGVLTGQLNTKTKEWLTVRPTLAEPQKKFTRSFLDASIAAIFGEKTSIGQVCAYAQGLKDEDVTTVPGFCCLDAPYEATYWGELVRYIYFVVKRIYEMKLLLDYLLTTRFLNCTFSIRALTEVVVRNIKRAKLNTLAIVTSSHHSQLGSTRLPAILFLGLGVQTQGLALN